MTHLSASSQKLGSDDYSATTHALREIFTKHAVQGSGSTGKGSMLMDRTGLLFLAKHSHLINKQLTGSTIAEIFSKFQDNGRIDFFQFKHKVCGAIADRRGDFIGNIHKMVIDECGKHCKLSPPNGPPVNSRAITPISGRSSATGSASAELVSEFESIDLMELAFVGKSKLARKDTPRLRSDGDIIISLEKTHLMAPNKSFEASKKSGSMESVFEEQ